MATEYRDGSFSSTEPYKNALRTFFKAAKQGTAKSFHVGSRKEIEEIKSIRSIEERLANIEEEMNSIKESNYSGPIYLPSRVEAEMYLKQTNEGN